MKYSGPYIRCFGIAAKDCSLYFENDRILRVIGHRYGYAWPVKVGELFSQFVDEYEEEFNMGITVYVHP